MDRTEDRAARPLGGAVGPGLLRGVLCGAAVGALSGAGVVAWISLAPAQVESGTPFSVFVMAYGTVLGMLLGAIVGLVAAAAALAVLTLGGARGGWKSSGLAAVAAGLVSLVIMNVAAQRADGVFLSAVQMLVVGGGSAGVAWWQVRGLVRGLDR